MSEYAPLFVKVDWGGKGEAKIDLKAVFMKNNVAMHSHIKHEFRIHSERKP